MKITELHQNISDYLKANSAALGVSADNIRKGKTGDYATDYPSILTHIQPNNDNEVYNNFDYDKTVSLTIATFSESEEEMYDISNMVNSLIMLEFRPYKFEYIDQQIFDNDNFIVYDFKLHL